MKRISFLVPTYNRAAFLAEALRAILREIGDDDEVLVIDDGSTDSTPEIAAAAGPRIRYVRQDNRGKSVALNRGMRETTGEFVWICDDDDRLRPGVVEPFVKALNDSDAGFIFGRYTRFDDQTGRDLGTGYWPDLSSGSIIRHVLEDAFVMQNAALVRRSAIEAVGPFSEAMLRSLDYEMFVRVACSYPAIFGDTVVFEQRKHSGARGPAAITHEASASMTVWNKYDAAIFANLRKWAPLELFEAMFKADSVHSRKRAALLERGVCMARHDCWDEARTDFELAGEASNAPLEREAVRICKRALAGKHGVAGKAAGHVSDGLTDLARRTGTGREIAYAILAGGLWRLRSPQAGEARTMLRLLVRVAGPRAPLVYLLRNSDNRSDLLLERSALPAGAYLRPGMIPPVANALPAVQ